MKKIYTLSSILTLVALMLLGQGCVKENGVDCPELGDNTLALRINVQDIAESRAALRADKTEAGQDPYNENKIEDFTVLFYRGGNLSWSQPSKGLTQDSNKNYIIPVPKEQMGEIDGKTSYNIYVVANHTFGQSMPQTEDYLKKVIVSESVKESKPAKFVMVGSVTKTINMSTTDGKQLGTVELKRVAAKVRLSLLTVKIDGYTQEGEAQAYLSNARNQGYMDKAENIGDLFPSDYRNVTEKITGIDKSAHFYSYYTKWEKDAKERPTLVLKLMLKKNLEDGKFGPAKAYYYKVPVEAKGQELKSNYLYDVKVKIEILGGLTVEEPQRVTGTLSIKEWTPHTDAYNLPATNYLLVAEKEVTMNNVATYNIDYQSSSPIHFKNIKAYAKYVDENGDNQTIEYKNSEWSTNSEFPKITSENGKIHIESKIPENYVPKTIEFDVTNDDGFTEHVKVTQYPSLYITNTFGTASSFRPNGKFDGEPHLKNKAIYKIVVQVPQDKLLDVDMILGFPPTQNQTFYYSFTNVWYNIFHEPVGTHLITKNDEETSKMVSPSFELASQLGASAQMPFFEYKDLSNTLNITYEGYPQALYYYYYKYKTYYTYNKSNNMRSRPWGAAYNCALYTETRDGKVLDDWRLPTEAEIRLVDKLQHAGKGVVKSIMTGRYYWDSYEKDGATKMDNPEYQTSATKTSAHVRCVRDVKDNTVTK